MTGENSIAIPIGRLWKTPSIRVSLLQEISWYTSEKDWKYFLEHFKSKKRASN